MIIQKLGRILILFIWFVVQVQSPQDLCSVYCRGDKCNSLSSNDCKECRGPWTDDGSGQCILTPNNGYAVVSVSSDTVSYDSPPNTLTTTGTMSGSCGGLTFYGNYSNSQTIQFTDSAGPDVPFYQIRIIFWAVLIDDWKNDDRIVVTTGSGQVLSQRKDSKIINEKVCGNNGNAEDQLIFDQSYNYNIPGPITITISQTGANSQIWGVKQVIILARLCHEYCLECFGSQFNQCTYCEQDTPYKLSGTTCALQCLAGYGDTIPGDICVFCDLKCINCYQISYNCSSCKTFGVYESYLWEDNQTCESVCPVGMWGNNTDHVCYPCQLFCISCRYAPDYCFQCDKTLGYAWNDYTCYNPCPISTFIDNNFTNCTECSPFCITCENQTTTCLTCTLTGLYEAYLLGTDCLRNCPVQYYKFTNNGTENTCQPCDISCYICTGSPTPCSQCNVNYYLYEAACGTTCPVEYFTDEVTWTCLLCETWCVKLTMKMYFPNALNEKLYVDMNFTEDLDFTTFPYQTFQTFVIDNPLYTLEMFNFTYIITSNRSYRIIMEPKGFIFLYNATITCTTIDYPGIPHEAANLRPFREDNYGVVREVVWFVIKAPDLTDTQKQIITGLSGISDVLSNVTTLPYVQELKKMGLFTLFFGGAQITSTSVLVNNIPSQNLYEGVRFWAIFIFFDVPLWEQNSDKTKYLVVPPVSDYIQNARMLQKRQLFDTNSIEWRFQRTGHTSFFIFDTYAMIILICISWVLVLIGYCLNKHKPLLFKKHMGKFYSLLHKVHEISILYVMLNTMMEWIYFDANSLERWLSFSFSLVFNIYFLIYELFIYYDMIKYPVATVGSQKYETYAIRYGSLLKNIRYEQYDLKEPWSPKQWFRPYNYHILAYYKKLMMIVSLPIFYQTTHAQILVLIALQIAEMIRFCVIWPFYRKWRNIYRLILESALLMFFITILVQGFLVQEIMLNNEDTLQYSIQLFYRFGWVGFGMCFFFNIGFIVLYIIDLVRGCRMSNRQMMDEARRIYYYDKLKQFEEENEDVPLGLVNKWVRLGNLNKRDYDELPDVNIRVEYFRIAKVPNSPDYAVEMKKLLELFINIQYNFSKQNNVSVGRKINKRFTLSKDLGKEFYLLVDDLYHKYHKFGLQSITIKTFQKVEQSLFQPGDKIELRKNQMTQKIELETHTGEKKVQNLQKMLQGFPIDENYLKFIA